MKRKTWLWVSAPLLASLALAMPNGAFSYPRTPAGKVMEAYVEAFNSGVEARIMAFFKEWLSPEALRRAPLEERLIRYREFKKEAGILKPERMLPEQGGSERLLVRNGQGGLLAMLFVMDGAAPGKLSGIRIENVAAADLEEMTGPSLDREGLLTEIDTFLAKKAGADEFSGVVLLALQGKTVFHRAYGLASIEYQVPNLPDTRFNLGSINKIFTRLAIEQLVEKGLLAKSDLLEKVLPDYPNHEVAQRVTVGQLVEMTSGLGDFFGPAYSATPKARLRTLADYQALFASNPLLFEPGSRREYSNAGYIVLGRIIEKASGQSYYDCIRDHIFAPAGMKDSAYLEADVPTPNVASGYTRNWDFAEHPKEPRRSNVYTRPARGSSAGGGYSTAVDLLRFVQAVRSGKLVGRAGWEFLAGPAGLAGGAPGINAFLELDPIPGAILVVLSNYDPPTAMEAGARIRLLLRRLKEGS